MTTDSVWLVERVGVKRGLTSCAPMPSRSEAKKLALRMDEIAGLNVHHPVQYRRVHDVEPAEAEAEKVFEDLAATIQTLEPSAYAASVELAGRLGADDPDEYAKALAELRDLIHNNREIPTIQMNAIDNYAAAESRLHDCESKLGTYRAVEYRRVKEGE